MIVILNVDDRVSLERRHRLIDEKFLYGNFKWNAHWSAPFSKWFFLKIKQKISHNGFYRKKKVTARSVQKILIKFRGLDHENFESIKSLLLIHRIVQFWIDWIEFGWIQLYCLNRNLSYLNLILIKLHRNFIELNWRNQASKFNVELGLIFSLTQSNYLST